MVGRGKLNTGFWRTRRSICEQWKLVGNQLPLLENLLRCLSIVFGECVTFVISIRSDKWTYLR